MFFRQVWKDHRLAFTGYNESIYLDYRQYHRLWVPDLYFKNEKKAKFYDTTVPNRLLKLAPDGTVLFSQRWVNVVCLYTRVLTVQSEVGECGLSVYKDAYSSARGG